MTIKEAINHARDVEKRNRKQYKNCPADRRDIEHQTCEMCAEQHKQLAEWLEELQKYISIGTVEECWEARERQRAKKRKLDSYCGFNSYECPVCGAEPVEGSNFCHKCGQRLG